MNLRQSEKTNLTQYAQNKEARCESVRSTGRQYTNLKNPGTSGNAKNYITRSQAVRKLQIPLSDFRRLCIFKGQANPRVIVDVGLNP